MDRRELTREQRLVAELLELFAVRLPLHLIEILQQTVERSELGDQLLGALLADARDAGDAVDRVTPQAHDVDDFLGGQSEGFGRRVAVEHRFAAGVEEVDVLSDELKEVLVGGCEHDVVAGVAGAAGECADDVISLIARGLDDRNPESLAYLADERNLHGEVVRHRFPVLLVVLELLVAQILALDVERHRHGVRLVLLEELPQHLDESVDGVGREPFGVRQTADRVVGAVEVVRSVDQVESRFLCSHRVDRSPFARQVSF